MTSWPSPCVLCGYNGPGFHQEDTHPCARARDEREALLHELERLRTHVLLLRSSLTLLMVTSQGQDRVLLASAQRTLDLTASAAERQAQDTRPPRDKS